MVLSNFFLPRFIYDMYLNPNPPEEKPKKIPGYSLVNKGTPPHTGMWHPQIPIAHTCKVLFELHRQQKNDPDYLAFLEQMYIAKKDREIERIKKRNLASQINE